MYNKKTHCWQSDSYDEAILKWAHAEENKNDPLAMFIIADTLLVTAERGRGNIDAVYFAETAAKAGNPRAALAMAQMFHYGWGVHQNKKTAREWYLKAAELGESEAIKYLNDLKKRKKKKLFISIASVVLAIAVIVASVFIIPDLFMRKGIRVNENTAYKEHTDMLDLALDVNELKTLYDDEEIQSGNKKANRLLLQFEGEYLDLSDFDAVCVIKDADGMVIVQFKTFEETERCYEYLKGLDGVVAISIDQYNALRKTIATPNDLTSTKIPYTSPHTRYTYLSWGVEYMGMDILAGWAMKNNPNSVLVAVLDTGCEPNEETISRYVEGFDFVDPTVSQFYDHDGHGTHVAGTIFDATRGLDVSILPVRVLGERGGSDMNVALGVKYAVQMNAKVINMSLGGNCDVACAPYDDCGSYLAYAIREAVSKGVVVVIAAGNELEDTVQKCPAHVGEAITVSGCCVDDTPYGTYNPEYEGGTNYGEAVDVCAPAYHVYSYYLEQYGGYAELTGTSMATPHIAALCAILKAAEPTSNYTPAQIEMLLKNYSVHMDNILFYGAGIPWAPHFAGY